MVSDDELTTVGSTNVDFRSFEHNFEVNAFIYDTETALQMREIFLQDQRECVQVFLKNWVKRPWWQESCRECGATDGTASYKLSTFNFSKKEKFTLPYTRLSTKFG